MISIETEAIVLRQIRYSESDLILVLFSRKLGKISAIVRGGKRTKSAHLIASQTFSYSNFTLTSQGDMYTVRGSDNIKSFYSISEDIESLASASFICSIVEKSIYEGQTNNRLFDMLIGALNILSFLRGGELYLKNDKRHPLSYRYVLGIFMLKLMDYAGYRPSVSSCVICGSHEREGVVFNTNEGGIICSRCKGGYFGNTRIDSNLIKLMEYILKNDIIICIRASVSPILLNQLYSIMREYLLYHMDGISFKSLDILK